VGVTYYLWYLIFRKTYHSFIILGVHFVVNPKDIMDDKGMGY